MLYIESFFSGGGGGVHSLSGGAGKFSLCESEVYIISCIVNIIVTLLLDAIMVANKLRTYRDQLLRVAVT